MSQGVRSFIVWLSRARADASRTSVDYHRDVEQAAFSPGSLVPGIELSPDTLLQWRAFL